MHNSPMYYLKMWVELCRLRIGPQDFPVSPSLLLMAFCAYVFSNIAISLLSVDVMQAVMVSLLDAVLLIFFLRVALYIRAMPSHLIQALTALLGAGALFGALMLPLVQIITSAQLSEQAPPPLVLLLWLFLVIWSLLVMGHILRHALSVRLATGIAVSITYAMLSLIVIQNLFPVMVVE